MCLVQCINVYYVNTHYTNYRGEHMFSGTVSSSCSTSDIRRVTLATQPVISHEWGKDQKVITTSGTYSRNDSRALSSTFLL
jgi:hypothetical protein